MRCMGDAVGVLEQTAYRTLDRMDPGDLKEIRVRGRALRERFDA